MVKSTYNAAIVAGRLGTGGVMTPLLLCRTMYKYQYQLTNKYFLGNIISMQELKLWQRSQFTNFGNSFLLVTKQII